MTYTINKLAKLSGVSIRTLRFYDEIGLLKPAFIGDQGYRYYQEKQLLILQQILFYKELGFELKQIEKILKQSDPDRIKALQAQKILLRNKTNRMQTLLKTIDKTINYLEGKIQMNEKEMFKGFDVNSEQQKKYEKELQEYLNNKFGAKAKEEFKKHKEESRKNVQALPKEDLQKISQEFETICKDLVELMNNNFPANSKEVQIVIACHFNWLKKFWIPNKESYAGHADVIAETSLSKGYEKYHPKLSQFISEAIKIFADKEL